MRAWKVLAKRPKAKQKDAMIFFWDHTVNAISSDFIEREELQMATLFFLQENTIQCLLLLNISKELYEDLWWLNVDILLRPEHGLGQEN